MKNCTPGLVRLLDISGSKNKMAEAVSGISFDMHSKATFKNATTTFIRLIWVGVPLIWVSLAGFGWVWVSLARFGWEHGLVQPDCSLCSVKVCTTAHVLSGCKVALG